MDLIVIVIMKNHISKTLIKSLKQAWKEYKKGQYITRKKLLENMALKRINCIL